MVRDGFFLFNKKKPLIYASESQDFFFFFLLKPKIKSKNRRFDRIQFFQLNLQIKLKLFSIELGHKSIKFIPTYVI